jgi:Zn-dependent protease
MEQLLTALPVLIFSIVVHEVAHGWVAQREGDPTAAMLGRLTLNPIPHLDPVGSILVPAVMMLLPGGFVFGWAKPVPVNPRNFRNYKRGDILVSLAGVASNFILAILFTVVLAAAYVLSGIFPGITSTWITVIGMAEFGILINLVLIVFNMVPIPPLDGSHVMYHLLPPALGVKYRQMGQYGMILVFAFLFLGGFRLIQGPIFFLFGAFYNLGLSLANLFS